jgi:hypothetical protein
MSTTTAAGAMLVVLPLSFNVAFAGLAATRVAAEPDARPARREPVDAVFQGLNRYLGVAVGEHLGGALTPVTYIGWSGWLIATGIALLAA